MKFAIDSYGGVKGCQLAVAIIQESCQTMTKDSIYIVYVIESAAYGVIFTSCLCESPNERVRAFHTNNE